MQPILARGPRLAVYVLACVAGAILLSAVLGPRAGVSLLHIAVVVLPAAILFGFVCLSSWYVCRATPLRTSALTTVVGNVAGSAVVAGAVWLGLVLAFARLMTRLAGLDDVEMLLRREMALVAGVGFLMYLLAMAVHYALLGEEEARLAEQRQLEVQLTAREAELKALRAQIEPHFLFNSLNSINALITANPEGAREMCVLLAEFLRDSLKFGARDRISLSDELALTCRYFNIERVRFGSRLKFEQVVDDGIGDVQVPPLILQPLAENAVSHGIAHLVEGGTVRLAARRNGSDVRIAIENPVDGDRPRRARRGLGLDNVRRRLATHYGGKAALEASESASHFAVTITLPGTTI